MQEYMELTRTECYLSAIALYLKVIWLFFVASIIGWLSYLAGLWALNHQFSCDDGYANSCDKNVLASNVIFAVGGLICLIVYSVAMTSGFKATKRIRNAEYL